MGKWSSLPRRLNTPSGRRRDEQPNSWQESIRGNGVARHWRNPVHAYQSVIWLPAWKRDSVISPQNPVKKGTPSHVLLYVSGKLHDRGVFDCGRGGWRPQEQQDHPAAHV